MKNILLLSLCAALGLGAGACQKQQSEAERQAEIEREVQQRLAAEHQARTEEQLKAREADLAARENAVARAQTTPVRATTPISAAKASPSAEAETGSYATFYRKLEPYGDWIETGNYGYVFQPRVAIQTNEWRPYAHGHWVYTDAGWTWISDEPFGWATYHYGRWIRLRSVGWVWVPGEQWAPAWVSWRRGNDYVGWAPLPPEARFDRETGIRNWADRYYDIGPEQYNFVPANEFGSKLTPREIVPPQRNVTIINQTTNVTNITYNNSIVVDQGPSYDDLRARSRQPIERLRLERTENATQDRPVIRGEVVALPVMNFRAPEPNARPPQVARKVAQPEVERGWTGIQDTQAAEQARKKIESEATPPANLPPKRFVRPGQAVAPSVSGGKMEPVGTPAPLPSNPPTPPETRATAAPQASASPEQSPGQRRNENRRRQEQRAQKRQAEREQKVRQPGNDKPATATPSPASKATPSPAQTAAAAATPEDSPNDNVENRNREQRQRDRGQRQEQRGQRPHKAGERTGRPTPSPESRAAESVSPNENAGGTKADQDRERRNRRGRQPRSNEKSPSPTPAG